VGSDKKIADLAKGIREMLGRRCSVVKIGPVKYNELYGKFRNLNRLLAWGHAQVIENLKAVVPACPRALSDQFANPRLIENYLKQKKVDIVLDSRTKAESDPAVAAASILARDAFVSGLGALGEPWKVELLKGAGAGVKQQAVQLFQQHGDSVLDTICKKHFKTYGEVTGQLPLSQAQE
jgi:ribonuclease HIII